MALLEPDEQVCVFVRQVENRPIVRVCAVHACMRALVRKGP